MASYRIGIDIGGTFTDFSLLDEGERPHARLEDALRRRPRREGGIRGITQLSTSMASRPEDIRYFIHGTTLAVNTVIQRAGAKTAFLVTRGLSGYPYSHIGRHRLPDVFNFFTELPRPLVPRSLVFEIPERLRSPAVIVRRRSTRRRSVRPSQRMSRQASRRSPSAFYTAIGTMRTSAAHGG